MRGRQVLLLSLCALSALTVLVVSRDEPETCPTTMTFEGRTYNAVVTADEVHEGTVVGDGTEHGCGHKGKWSQAVSLARVPGVDPDTALATPTAGNLLYIAVGFTESDLPTEISDLIGET